MFPACTAVYTMRCLTRKTFKSFVKLKLSKIFEKIKLPGEAIYLRFVSDYNDFRNSLI